MKINRRRLIEVAGDRHMRAIKAGTPLVELRVHAALSVGAESAMLRGRKITRTNLRARVVDIIARQLCVDSMLDALLCELETGLPINLPHPLPANVIPLRRKAVSE